MRGGWLKHLTAALFALTVVGGFLLGINGLLAALQRYMAMFAEEPPAAAAAPPPVVPGGVMAVEVLPATPPPAPQPVQPARP